MKIVTFIFAISCLFVCFMFAFTENIPMTVFWGVLALWNKLTCDNWKE